MITPDRLNDKNSKSFVERTVRYATYNCFYHKTPQQLCSSWNSEVIDGLSRSKNAGSETFNQNFDIPILTTLDWRRKESAWRKNLRPSNQGYKDLPDENDYHQFQMDWKGKLF
jgi:hypothetical protein